MDLFEASAWVWNEHPDDCAALRWLDARRTSSGLVKLDAGPVRWAVVGHAAARTVLQDAQRFTSRFGTGPRHVVTPGRSLNLDDPPRSTPLRREVELLLRAPDSLEAAVRAQVTRLVEGRDAFDVVTEVAQPLALATFGAVVGLTDPDRLETLGALTRALPRAGDAQQFATADVALLRWLRQEAGGPGGFFHVGASLSDEDGVYLRRLLAQTGHESTAMAISLAMLRFAQGGPFVAPAPLIRFVREATAQTTLGGETISRGDRLAVFFPAVDRDPEAGGATLQFGAGPHVCAGRHLAALQLRVAGEVLCRARWVVRAFTPLISSVTRGVTSLRVERVPGPVPSS